MGQGDAVLQQFASIDAQAAQLTGFDQQYEQLKPGEYSGAFFAAEEDGAAVFIEQTNRSLLQRGAGPADQLSAIILLEEGSEETRSNGVSFTSEDVLLVGPGGSYDATVSAHAIPAVVNVPIGSNLGLRLQAERLGPRVRRVQCRDLADRFRAFSLRSLQSFDATTLTATVPATEAQLLMMSLLTAQAAVSGSAHPSVKTFRDAQAQMIIRLSEPMTIGDLASSIGTSRRSLEQSFMQCVEMSPARFWKKLRLNNTRRLLETGNWTVTAAILASGLNHLGRTSADYYELFGELPSATASRSLIA